MGYYDEQADSELAKYIESMKAEGLGPDELYESPSEMLRHMTGLCGCGSGEDFNLLWEVLTWCDSGNARHEPKGNKGMYVDAAHELAAKVLDRAGLIEHGTGIGWPWSTPLGKGLLKWKQAANERR